MFFSWFMPFIICEYSIYIIHSFGENNILNNRQFLFTNLEKKIFTIRKKMYIPISVIVPIIIKLLVFFYNMSDPVLGIFSMCYIYLACLSIVLYAILQYIKKIEYRP